MNNTLKIFSIIILLTFISCQETYYPRSHGYLRIDFPEKEYKTFNENYPYTFEMPVYSEITKDKSKGAEEYWSDWNFPKYNATVYLSYKNVENNLSEFEEDTRELAYKHTIKADEINQVIWNNKEKKVYGILYDIKGNVASQVQFYLTDSTKHFLRGAFYFNCVPNKDSLAPSLKYLRKDIDKMIETFEWKDLK